MGAPAIPLVPASRLKFVTLRSLPGDDRMEPATFAFLTDTQEWVSEDLEDVAEIQAALPAARIFRA